jgi:hypothetical protein
MEIPHRTPQKLTV